MKESILEIVNKNNCLTNYISHSRDFLSLQNYIELDRQTISKLIHIFSFLNVSFVGIEYDMVDTNLFNAVYEACLYYLNVENLFLIQKKILKMSDGEILHRNYTLLLKNYTKSSLTKYVNENPGQYLDIVLQICDGYILDDETAIVAILNNAMITSEQKRSYISVLQTSVTSIEEIEDTSLWAIMLDAQILLPSESNIIRYFFSPKKLMIILFHLLTKHLLNLIFPN